MILLFTSWAEPGGLSFNSPSFVRRKTCLSRQATLIPHVSWLAQLKHLTLDFWETFKVSKAAILALCWIVPTFWQAFKYSIVPPCSLMGLIIAWQSLLALSKASCFKMIFRRDVSLRLRSTASFNLLINWAHSSVGPCNIFTKDPSEVELSILAHALIAFLKNPV